MFQKNSRICTISSFVLIYVGNKKYVPKALKHNLRGKNLALKMYLYYISCKIKLIKQQNINDNDKMCKCIPKNEP